MPDDSREKVWQVCEINAMVQGMLNETFRPFWMTGEIGNLTIHSSGHVYMTLKDASSQIKTVFFNGAAQCRMLKLCQGHQVEVFGKPSIYVKTGDFQFYANAIRLCGTGSLQEQFELLKKKLMAEGLFSPERKRTIPFFPRQIGLITSSSGAAVRDFIKVAHSRFPGIGIRICPAPVQGKGAEIKLAAAVRFFNRVGGVDVIVLTRGGGSLEDLWPFNEEILAREIAASRIPTVSAVGHEIDFTIADFVADLRAATPSAAAELLVPEKKTLEREITSLRQRSINSLKLAFESIQRKLDTVRSGALLSRIENKLNEYRQRVDCDLSSSQTLLANAFQQAAYRLETARAKLPLCSPMNTVKRGFVILLDRNNPSEVITTVKKAEQHKQLRAIMTDGTIDLNTVPESAVPGK